jgi:hypothetical protein
MNPAWCSVLQQNSCTSPPGGWVNIRPPVRHTLTRRADADAHSLCHASSVMT